MSAALMLAMILIGLTMLQARRTSVVAPRRLAVALPPRRRRR